MIIESFVENIFVSVGHMGPAYSVIKLRIKHNIQLTSINFVLGMIININLTCLITAGETKCPHDNYEC